MSVDEPLLFRWLGVAGIELAYRSQILAIDPFFTRPPLRQMVWGRPQPDATLAAEKLPECHYILVSHPHYDHLMDAPAIALNTGAALYGSANTCRIASLSGVPDEQIHEVSPGELLDLGEFEVQFQGTQHMRTPVDQWLNGALAEDLRLPLRVRDYRMDCCFAFLIRAGGLRFLFNKGLGQADILAFAPLQSIEADIDLLRNVQPRLVIPIHWDNFFRPLDKPSRPLPRPPKFLWSGLNSQGPVEFKRQVEAELPGVRVHIPTLLERVDLNSLV